MFNFGASELTVMAVLAVLFVGPEKLPTWFGYPSRFSRFSLFDWLRVSAALLAVTAALALFSGARY